MTDVCNGGGVMGRGCGARWSRRAFVERTELLSLFFVAAAQLVCLHDGHLSELSRVLRAMRFDSNTTYRRQNNIVYPWDAAYEAPQYCVGKVSSGGTDLLQCLHCPNATVVPSLQFADGAGASSTPSAGSSSSTGSTASGSKVHCVTCGRLFVKLRNYREHKPCGPDYTIEDPRGACLPTPPLSPPSTPSMLLPARRRSGAVRA